MSLQSIDIFGFNSGLQKNKKPFLLTEDAFVTLENAYVWRGEVKKREGMQLIGRYRRRYDNTSLGNSTANVWNFNIYSTITPAITGEPNALIEPGSVRIYINPTITSGAITGYTNASDCEFTTGPTTLITGDTVTVSGVVIVPDTGLDQANNEWTNIEALANSFKIGVDSHAWGTYASGGTWTNYAEGAGVKFVDQGDGLLTTDIPGNFGGFYAYQ